MSDSDLIDALGGPTKLAERLGMPKGGPQRVCNWRKRGIPARVKLAHPEVFLRNELASGPNASSSALAEQACDAG